MNTQISPASTQSHQPGPPDPRIMTDKTMFLLVDNYSGYCKQSLKLLTLDDVVFSKCLEDSNAAKFLILNMRPQAYAYVKCGRQCDRGGSDSGLLLHCCCGLLFRGSKFTLNHGFMGFCSILGGLCW